jgi:hypothetical protein
MRNKTLIYSMKFERLANSLMLLLLLMLFAAPGAAQTRPHRIESAGYSIDLPSDKWRPVQQAGITQDRTYVVYEDRSVGLHIRREIVDAGVTAMDLIEQRNHWDRISLRGYSKTRTESFAGHLSGAKYAYEYISEGSATAKLIYYLQANNRTIYRLEFTGTGQDLMELSDQIELIASSFRLR